MLRPFRQIDVFGDAPFTGNPVAVVADAEGLADDELARISMWSNLSECTFLLAPTTPGADYRVRIFNLAVELPFAGHPTLGTARAWLDLGGVPADPEVIVQECPAGLVRVRRDGEGLAFAAPPTLRGGDVEPAYLSEVVDILGIRPVDVVAAQWVDNGPGWVAVLLADADAVLAVAPSTAGHPGRWDIGVAGFHPTGDLEVRGFFTHGGPLVEDPVTGSLNASLAQWLTASGRVAVPYTARQGTVLGRRGRVQITADGEHLWVGGATRIAVRGDIDA